MAEERTLKDVLQLATNIEAYGDIIECDYDRIYDDVKEAVLKLEKELNKIENAEFDYFRTRISILIYQIFGDFNN